MLAQASTTTGRGRAFAVHEAAPDKYGTFTAVYGQACLAGSTVIGGLRPSITAVIVSTVATQVLALAAFVPLTASQPDVPTG
jgi:hypothetical protein